MSPPTNQHPAFYRPDDIPVAQPTVLFANTYIKGVPQRDFFTSAMDLADCREMVDRYVNRSKEF